MTINHPTPEDAFSPTPTAANLCSSLKEMLDCYWGQGDGDTPPLFIQKAQTLIAAFEAQQAKRP